MQKQQWLEWRKIGSSDAPVIMNESPYSTPFQLWEKRISKNETIENYAMRRGTEMEDTARRSFEKRFGLQMFPRLLEHRTLNFMTASMDGMDLDGKTAVEIKCPGKEDHAVAKEKKVPKKYYAQLQHQLEVTGLDEMYYYSFDGREGEVVEVKRDQPYIDELLEKEEEFWTYIINCVAPALTDRDYIDKSADSEWVRIAHELSKIKKDLKEWDKKEKELVEQLKSLCEGKNAQGDGYKLSRSMKKGNVDYSQIPELEGKNLDQYRKDPIFWWRFS